MKAIILSAGIGSRLYPITANKPKGMIEVGGKPIIQHQIDLLHPYVDEIIVVTGYKHEMFDNILRGRTKIVSPDYLFTNNMFSFYIAMDKVDDFFLLNGDVLLDPEIVKMVAEYTDEEGVIAAQKDAYNKESMKIMTHPDDGRVFSIAKDTYSDEKCLYGVSIDFYKFTGNASKAFKKSVNDVINTEHDVRRWVEQAMDRTFREYGNQLDMNPLDIGDKKWIEIDNFDDLHRAEILFNPMRKSIMEGTDYFIDIDGTLMKQGEVLPGAKEFVDYLRERNKRIHILTNNSSMHTFDRFTNLRLSGLIKNSSELITSTHPTIAYLQKKRYKRLYLMSTMGTRQEFEDGGFEMVDKDPEAVVLTFDTTITFKKLTKATNFIRAGLPYYATHIDKVCPQLEGVLPDAGSFSALLEAATGRLPDKVFGKPNGDIISADPANSVMIGDRLYTDILMANNLGMLSICTLTGATDRAMIENTSIKPDIIVKRLDELCE